MSIIVLVTILAIFFIVMGAIFLFMIIRDGETLEISFAIVCILWGSALLAIPINSYKENIYKKALDYNPYIKEYVYKQVNDSTYIITDSLYIKKSPR